ncbi:DUF1566 domain-containing protein [Bacteroidales bacterium OttesenSCG-928-B11]|nr:DUF1566 domain-containing protein [Bacteroidales bacterium OttesenSCG-928-E04]MDL2308862.1 DUF1566 domain-containing protein [Bacteroidales bacterium OttesenSCG-928-C03]MDL2312831.1 DUF1566 domain-containing protein [Bacteroidales bacterium OttesenSCG-928-B11]MDL2325846.1 DUF1566 domain-containing protein [Bacteroidales bacterium OttesenSCG-928-A14]
MKKLLSIAMCLCLALSIVGCDKDDDSENGGSSGKTYDVGDYYNEGGVKGIVYKVTNGGKNGMIISMDEGTNLAWQKETSTSTGATDEKDGTKNMAKIKASSSGIAQFPAFKWCDDKNKGGVTGWYLPAKDEVLEISQSYLALQVELQANGGSTFGSNQVWSSTEDDVYLAYYIDMNNKRAREYDKNSAHGFVVRAVKSF